MKKKIGLALGSGAVRGLAHIGVLKVLEEKNIKIDLIAGSSIGAIIGAMYASGKTTEEIEVIAHSIDWKGLLKLADPVLGRGMFKGNKLKSFLAKHIDATTFDELKIPMVIVATDIKSGESLEIKKGDLLDAVRASISVPFVFSAVKVQGHTCGDAGLSQPVPVEALQKMGAEKIIAVDLDAVFFKKNNRGKVTKIDSIALNSINLMRYNLAKCNTRDADIVITPESGRIYWNRFVSPQSVIDAGEDAAKRALKE